MGIKTLNLEKNKQLLNPIADVLEQYLVGILGNEDIVKIKFVQNHCKSLLKHYFLLNELAKSALYGSLGSVYEFLGDYSKAEDCLQKSFLSLGNEKENSNRIACNLERLGDTYSEIGKHKEARNHLEKSIKLYKKHFSKNHNCTDPQKLDHFFRKV